MVGPKDVEGSDDDEYQETSKKVTCLLATIWFAAEPTPQKRNARKKRRLTADRAAPAYRRPEPLLSLEPLLNQLSIEGDSEGAGFDGFMEQLLPDLLHARAIKQEQELEVDENGRRLRNLTRAEVASMIEDSNPQSSPMLMRKLKLHQAKTQRIDLGSYLTPHAPPHSSPTNAAVIDSLNSIRSTPYEHSFLSRLHGFQYSIPPDAFAVDWETVTPWMRLMSDMREHYSLAHPERDQPKESMAPLVFSPLRKNHLPQVHDLLTRTFWPGIDVTDSLEMSPERCTVVTTYKKLVVGIAMLSSPQESYITYLAVKAGWDNAHIARSMLYHLITLNPKRDITLHVSANNSAMLLYNRFGFKAEGYVVGFYEDYLSPQSCQSKNAFRLRLRQQ
ncbi:hypothetical protein AX16_006563 [Volvariella volvacea WC 439]|nr:hypothetical protein AX16_006563 [Volvariella volvacea WC 439]